MQTIYEPKGKAKEYGDLALNIYTGCPHRCVYCYVPATLRKDREVFHSCVEPRKNIVEETKKRLDNGDIKGKEIFLCFTCDPFPVGYDHSPTHEIIQAIKESGNNVAVLTKGRPDMTKLNKLLTSSDRFGVTISGAGRSKEQNATNGIILLGMLRKAKAAGIKTFVSCEPVYDKQTIYNLITMIGCIDEYRIGKLNYAHSDINWSEFGQKCERLCLLHNRNYMIKESLRSEMELIH